jgi:hypothetical protein
MWRHSGLGRRIVAGDQQILEKLGIAPDQQQAIQEFLTSDNSVD